ncbi:hypothetical protein Cantr_05692 [Candida viswanathii]|uniref:Uncharacterized protein n=1 Tax=Candida viswanathii TaxID=5486 RepID=A0A367XRE8_9ASCO|nr:hypothetical protein Cantr_05692 [Candida viswanathii]
MGRTGRKRDGKVLFYGGYEYIQQRIMKGDLFQLRPQNRIIPESYTPEVVKTLIEIPEEKSKSRQRTTKTKLSRLLPCTC